MSLFIQVIPEWLEFVALALSTGVLVCLLWVLPSGGPSRNGTVLEGTWQLLGVGVAAAFASSILGVLLRAAEMSGQPISGVLPALPTVVLRTHLGKVWIIRMAALALLAVAVAAGRRRPRSRRLPSMMLGCAIVISATESASGHASDAGDLSVAEIMDWLHLLGSMTWGGGLLVLSMAILPPLVPAGDRAAASIAHAASRFSAIAGVAVAFIALTAAYQGWTYAGSVEALVRSPYGWMVIAKVVLFSLLLCLGAFNRYVSIPRLQVWAGSASTRPWLLGRLIGPVLRPLARDARGPLVAKQFARSVKVEAFLLLAVLLCAAVLRHEIPARHARHMAHETSVMRPDR